MIDRDTAIALAKQAGALRFSHPYRDEESDSWAASTDNIERFAKLVEQKAIESQKQIRRETEAMAECMDMVRQDLITAGVVDKSVPPMMLAEAVIAAQHMAVSAEREACARINSEKSDRLGQEAEEALEEGDRNTCTSNRAAAHLLSVCAARIRARGTGGEG